jgi:uncharacterized protein (UPF0264 family)
MQLLVSVVDVNEAEKAASSGAEILDLKNSEEGSLGAAHPALIYEVCHRYGRNLPVSAAIGDFPYLPNTAALAGLCAAEMGADYIKVGLLGPKSEDQVLCMLTSIQNALTYSKLRTKPKLIAACYADYHEAGTINPINLPRLANTAYIAGCMIDTLSKNGKCLFDYMEISEIIAFIKECKKYNLLSALAGSLKQCHLELLKELNPDIIGVRGAVCRDGVRTGAIDQQKIAEFMK